MKNLNTFERAIIGIVLGMLLVGIPWILICLTEIAFGGTP